MQKFIKIHSKTYINQIKILIIFNKNLKNKQFNQNKLKQTLFN